MLCVNSPTVVITLASSVKILCLKKTYNLKKKNKKQLTQINVKMVETSFHFNLRLPNANFVQFVPFDFAFTAIWLKKKKNVAIWYRSEYSFKWSVTYAFLRHRVILSTNLVQYNQAYCLFNIYLFKVFSIYPIVCITFWNNYFSINS